MKKFKLTTGILIMLMIASTMVFSQTKEPVKTQNDNQEKTTLVNTGRNFVDQNNDGICDNRQNNQSKQVQGRNFVDKNNDGICDNNPNGNPNCKNGKGNQNNCRVKNNNCCGNGNGYRHGQSNGCRKQCRNRNNN
jgi:hypothetical protein